ncbi:MAG: DUF5724 domain-containing protein [Limisphaerales bacterium]
MLNLEQAQAELKKLENKQWVEIRVASVASMSEAMRGTARMLLGQEDAPGLLAASEQARATQKILGTFSSMNAAARLKFFEAFFPGLAATVERGWQLLDRLPYQAGWGRKPFRAPGHPDALLIRRVNWVSKLVSVVGPYQQGVTWFAAWAPHLAQYTAAGTLGILLAASIDAGGDEGDEVFETLCASARGEHAIGAMGRHVTRALLSAARPDGWEFVEKLLLAAQREEGLRQTILESVDEAHPEAFRRMLRLILEHDLARFSATVRAFDVWLGYQWDAVSAGVVNATIERMLVYLEDPAAREAATGGKDAEQAYLALWTMAFDDAPAAVAPAAELLRHSKAEHRFVAAHLLDQLQLIAAHEKLLPALDDADLRVTTRAMKTFQHEADERLKSADLFERLERLLPRYPDKATKLKPIVWPWTAFNVSKESIADTLPGNLGLRPPTRLIPHLPRMGVHRRASVVGMLAAQQRWDTATRDTLFALVGDPSRQVREAALLGLAKCKITGLEAVAMEKLLDRKSSDLRRGVLTLLSLQPDADALASADRLLPAKSQPQRLAGLELLRELVEEQRVADAARARAEQYRAAHPTLSDAERRQLDAVLSARGDAATLDNALGLVRHEDRTWPAAPVARGVQFHSPAARRIVATLDEMLKARAQEMVTFKNAAGEDWKGLLSDLTYGFPHPDTKKSPAEDRQHLPLAEVWEHWWQTRGPELRDADGMELVRAIVRYDFAIDPYRGPGEMLKAFPDVVAKVFGEVPDKTECDRWKVRNLLSWLLRLHPPAGAVDFILDAAESALALVPTSDLLLTEAEAEGVVEANSPLKELVNYDPQGLLRRLAGLEAKARWRAKESPFAVWLQVAYAIIQNAPQLWTPAHYARHWRLHRWMDEPVRSQDSGGGDGAPPIKRCLQRDRANLVYLAQAHQAGSATDADIVEQLLGPRAGSGYWSFQFSDLGEMTRRKIQPVYAPFDFIRPLADQCRRRVLEVELTRGDNPTVATPAALSLRSVWSIDDLIAILRALGQGQFVRGGGQDNQNKETVFSHLVRCCFPREGETSADFKAKALAAKLSEDRLVELAVYAPQWAAHAEHALGWKGLTEAVWWIHAHTKGTDWSVDNEIRELWQADLSSRTALSAADLLEGAVDVAWFLRVFEALGDKRWSRVDEAAKFASTGAGHARARLFADAMLGKAKKKELVQRIRQKRYQDAVRALGLLPLAKAKAREADLLERYKVIQEFRRGSKQFGSQRQASEKRAAQIGQQNLARTAGFADPIRLEWAMEAKAVEDLADGPIEVAVEGVKLSLGIDPWGEVELSVTRDGKVLADIPAKLKKHPKVAALRERKVELKRQASRIRPSLEQFMVRGDEFTGAELRELMEHPLLRPMLANLVLIGEGIAGYPVYGGKALEDHRGEVEAVKAGEKLRIAHPHDLLPATTWHRWQKDCFARERIQPFKQVFREFYPLTAAEKLEGTQTRRYAGHQVQPRQALALLGGRGWVHHPEEGVRKVFHDAGLVAWLHFQESFFTPAEVEGLTLEGVCFTKRGEHEVLKLTSLPARLFSETMRDLDLVVSVAHRGGVDPEASASTVEMRAVLVEESCRLLKLGNVQVKDRYALVKGKLGEYSVHLGSAVTRKMPGETLFIVPVHSQHRGRLFLPFADDDPRTAEVMSKVLLLARDREIKDPGILDQIRGR